MSCNKICYILSKKEKLVKKEIEEYKNRSRDKNPDLDFD